MDGGWRAEYGLAVPWRASQSAAARSRPESNSGAHPSHTPARDIVWSLLTVLVATAALAALSIPDLGIGLTTVAPPGAADPSAPVASDAGLGAPGGPGLLASTLVSRLLLAVAPGSPVDRLGLLALLSGALSVWLLLRLNRRLGLDPAPAALGALIVASGGTMLALATTGSTDAVVLPLLAGVLLCVLRYDQEGRPSALAALAGVTVAAVGSYPAIAVVVLVPLVSPAVRRRRGWRPVLVAAGAAALGLAHRLVAAGGPGLAFRPAGDLLSAASTTGAAAAGEVGLLGGLLSLAGVTWLARRGPGRRLVVTAAVTGVFVTACVSPAAVADQAIFLLLVWLPAGAGLQWLRSSGAGAAGRVAATALGLLLLASNLLRHAERIPWHADPARTEQTGRLLDAIGRDASLLAAPILARALSVWPGVDLLPPDAAAVRRRFEAGRAVYALAEVPPGLARLGLQFSAVPRSPATAPLDELVAALPARSVVALAATGPFAQAIGVAGSAMLARLGAAGPAGEGAYTVVGVAEGGGRALEHGGLARVALDVEAGAPLGSHVMRATGGLRLGGGPSEATVEVDGDRLAAGGLALVALTPDGRVLTSFGLDAGDGLRAPLPDDVPRLWRLAGAEPVSRCRPASGWRRPPCSAPAASRPRCRTRAARSRCISAGHGRCARWTRTARLGPSATRAASSPATPTAATACWPRWTAMRRPSGMRSPGYRSSTGSC